MYPRTQKERLCLPPPPGLKMVAALADDKFNKEEVVRMFYVAKYNCHQLGMNSEDTETDNDNDGGGMALFPLVSVLNHSCWPNVTHHTDEKDRMVVRAIAPIEAGEEICDSYINIYQGRKGRQTDILQAYGFVCACPRCEGDDANSRVEEVLCERCGARMLQDDETHTGMFSCTQRGCGHYKTQQAHDETMEKLLSLFSKGDQLFRKQKCQTALMGWERLILDAKKVLGPCHAFFTGVLVAASNVSMVLGDWRKAETFISQAVQNAQSCLPVHHPMLVPLLVHQALCMHGAGKSRTEVALPVSRASNIHEVCYGGSDALFRKKYRHRLVNIDF